MKQLLLLFSIFLSSQLAAYEISFDGDYLENQQASAILVHQQNGEVLSYRILSERDYKKGVTITLADIFIKGHMGVSFICYSPPMPHNYKERANGRTFFPIPNGTHFQWDYSHPSFSSSMMRSSLDFSELSHINGLEKLWYCKYQWDKDSKKRFPKIAYSVDHFLDTYVAFKPVISDTVWYTIIPAYGNPPNPARSPFLQKEDLKVCDNFYRIELPYYAKWRYSISLHTIMSDSIMALSGEITSNVLDSIPIPNEFNLYQFDLSLTNDSQSYFYSGQYVPESISEKAKEEVISVNINSITFGNHSLAYSWCAYRDENNKYIWGIDALPINNLPVYLPVIPEEILLVFPSFRNLNRPYTAKIYSYYPQKPTSAKHLIDYFDRHFRLKTNTVIDIYEVNL